MRTRKRRFRAFRNLLIAVLFLTAAWWRMGCPMPTRTMELHRSEEVYLIDRRQTRRRQRGSPRNGLLSSEVWQVRCSSQAIGTVRR